MLTVKFSNVNLGRDQNLFKQAAHLAYNYYPEVQRVEVLIDVTKNYIVSTDKDTKSLCNGLCVPPKTRGKDKYTIWLTIAREDHSICKLIKTLFHEIRHVWQFESGYMQRKEFDKTYWIREHEVDARQWADCFFNENYFRLERVIHND